MGYHYSGISGRVSRSGNWILPWTWEVTRRDGKRIAWGEEPYQSMAFEVCEGATFAAREWWSVGRRHPWVGTR